MLLLSIVLILVAGALLLLILGLCQAADAGDRMAEKANRRERVQKICPLCLEEYINGGAHFERCYGRVVREDLLAKNARPRFGVDPDGPAGPAFLTNLDDDPGDCQA